MITKPGALRYQSKNPRVLYIVVVDKLNVRLNIRFWRNRRDQWDVRVTINGETIRAMTAYSYFGNSKPPLGFVVALLGEDRSEMLVYSDKDKDWLEFGDYTYRKCNGPGGYEFEERRSAVRDF